MAHGGAREGAGRKVGSTTTKTREIADKALESGLTPLEYMLEVMRDTRLDEGRRLDAAKSAAPYVHPRLSNIDMKADVDGKLSITVIKRIYDADGKLVSGN